jgi:hypothetical protein
MESPPEMQSPTLESIPPEILSSIAYYLAISLDNAPNSTPNADLNVDHPTSALASALSPASTSIPSVTPAPLLPLLRTSRTIHSTLRFHANAHLYARVFEEKFDVAAARRRLGYDEVNDIALAEELRTRCVAMRDLKEAVKRGDITLFTEQDIYTVYLMLLENGESASPSLFTADIRHRRKEPQVPPQPGGEHAPPRVSIPLPRPGPRPKGDIAGPAAAYGGTHARLVDHLAIDVAS